MKIVAFYFKYLERVRNKTCLECGQALGKTLEITFSARPNDEWEMRAECRSCRRDYTVLARVANAFGSGKPQKVQSITEKLS